MSTMAPRHTFSAQIRQRGIAIVTAIFLIVILAALAAFSVSLFRIQQVSTGLASAGTRALQAANSGLEWGYWQVLDAGGPACAATTNLAMPAGTGLGLFTVTVTCTSTPHTEAGNPVTNYRLQATACSQPAAGACPNPAPGSDYIERQVQGMVER